MNRVELSISLKVAEWRRQVEGADSLEVMNFWAKKVLKARVQAKSAPSNAAAMFLERLADALMSEYMAR